MQEKIKQFKNEIKEKIENVGSGDMLESLRIEYVGKKGKITETLRQIGSLPIEERKTVGKELNILKKNFEEALKDKKAELSVTTKKPATDFDYTLPGLSKRIGHLHPITQTIQEISAIFVRLGFEVVAGREIETEKYNFTALNIPLDHSSRDAFDTYYTNDGNLLRSQTSTVQVRIMESRKPPLSIIAPGKVYRPDTVDANHSFMFHQIEGLMVDRSISFSDLKGILHLFLKEYFGAQSKMRFRPHFFPFTEPSVEVDVSCFKCKGKGCSTCSHQGWLEVLGAGSVDPHVFEAAGYTAHKYQGLAFGLGIERMCMLKNGIHDIRLFFENNLKFLNQF
ncbi:MAG: phenylalanine--tRNA ligase subunit alpha [Candidatus Omnitrophica bacterium]|nr:phenylalanine--tRNA ligase subunit alpha [Candidatus Omnitrophota bacterium]